MVVMNRKHEKVIRVRFAVTRYELYDETVGFCGFSFSSNNNFMILFVLFALK